MTVAYLSKKIAIPNCNNIKSLDWNNEHSWIACGGDTGLLKVIKLETSTEASNNGGSQLSMNQTLDGHKGTVVLTIWNKHHEKLTTADSNGLVIVWVLFKGVWYEEMVNNRNNGLVTGMEWDRIGSRICIIYEDGAVILGSVDGNRIWGKEIKNTSLAHIQWAPDGKFLVFGTSNGSLQLFDQQGVFVSKIQDFWHGNTDYRISSLQWYNGAGGHIQADVPCLAVCYEDGKVQILRNQRDLNPIKFSISMTSIRMKWNNNGTLLAIAGIQILKDKDGKEKETVVVQFWNPFGEHLKSVKIPGNTISSISWEAKGLRLAVAVDSFIFFANVRIDYKWAFIAGEVLLSTFLRPDSCESSMTFWNTKTDDRFTKNVENLLAIHTETDHVLAISKTSDGSLQTILTAYNAIGVPVDSKLIDFEPKYAAFSGSNVICATESIIFYWQVKSIYGKKISALDALRRKDALDRAFHIDDYDIVGSGEVSYLTDELMSRAPSNDLITAVAVSDSILLVGRESGDLYQYLIPSMTLDNKYSPEFEACSIKMNCNSTRASLVDRVGVMKLMQLDNTPPTSGRGMVMETHVHSAVFVPGLIPNFERKDVSDLIWCKDDSKMFSTIEKTRLYIFNDIAGEPPILNSGYLCDFSSLQVRVANLDEIVNENNSPSKDLITTYEASYLRDLKALIATDGLLPAIDYAMNKNSLRLWKEISNSALLKLQFDIAAKAFVQSKDYQGLQLIKRLKKIDDPMKKQAEIYAYCFDFEAAERTYIDMDRKDLALDLRIRLGDWFRVVQLIKSGNNGDDALLEKAWNKIGDYYYERQRWAQAITYYSQGRNIEKQVEIFYILEDFENIEKIAVSLNESSPFLRDIADKFLSAGLCRPAFNAYMKIGDVSAAINACVTLNQWSTAITLAETHHSKEVEQYLSKYASHIISQNRQKEAVELYRKANYCLKSAKILFEMAETAIKDGKGPDVIKKCFVLAALEVERHHSIQKNSPSAAMSSILPSENSINKLYSFEKPWRGAETYHFYMLAQNQFYTGQLSAAVCTASRLRDYEDILGEVAVYSLLALVSLHAGYYGTCSKAFLKLESLQDSNLEHYQNLAVDIFTRFAPKDPSDGDILVCSNCVGAVNECDTCCNSCGMQFPACIASGRPVVETVHFMCHICKHRALESEICSFNFCPLCHTTL